MSAVEWLILPLISGIIGAIIWAEAKAWVPRLQLWLIERTTSGLSDEDRVRYQEEFLAELHALPDGPLTRLTWASSLFLRRRSLVAALGGSRSRRQTRTIKVRGLRVGEEIVTITRASVPIWPFPVFCLAPAGIAYIAALYLRYGTSLETPFIYGLLAIAVALLLCFSWSIRRILVWHSVRYIISNLSVSAASGNCRRSDQSTHLAKIRNVSVQQTVWQRMKRSGDIRLESSTGSSLLLTHVPEAARFRDIVLDSIDDHE